MEFYTRLFENGQWVTRQVDPYNLLARSRVLKENRVQALSDAPKPPSLGILTRTLIKCPVIKWIIPARVRHADKNDVLYIGSNSVELREVREDYTVRHVSLKDDFDSAIRAAKIFGRPRLPTKGDINAIVPKVQDDTRDPMDIVEDVIRTQEYARTNRDGHAGLDDEQAYSMERAPFRSRTLPPHLLVLALESSQLVFLYAVSGDHEKPCILSQQIALYQSGSYLERLGEHLAVDPKSRAMAVGARENLFYIFAMRSMDELEVQVRSGPSIHPILSERAVRVEGTILKMEFLHPSQTDDAHVILVLIVSKGGKSRIFLYQWDSTVPLRHAQLDPHSYPLPSEQHVPLLLVPLLYSSGFILVHEQQLTFHTGYLAGSVQKVNHPATISKDEPEEPASSKRAPLWVQWARVVRPSRQFSATEDDIYLCREDGKIQFLRIRPNATGWLDTRHRAESSRVNVDSAFAALDPGPQNDDLLAIGGDGCESRLSRLEAHRVGRTVSVDLNWTPLIDVTTSTLPAQTSSSSLRNRIFACAGKGKHGIVTEIRYGYSATRHQRLDVDGLAGTGVLAVWALRFDLLQSFVIFVSMPKRTHVILIRPDEQDTNNDSSSLITEHEVLDLHNRTLAVHSTLDGHVIQITERSVQISTVSESQKDSELEDRRYSFGFSQIIAAHIENFSVHSIVLVTLKANSGYQLVFGLVDPAKISFEEPIPVHYRPSAVSLVEVKGHVLALVGGSDSKFRIYLISDDLKSLSLMVEQSLGGDFAICESIAHSRSKVEDGLLASKIIIACGLRDGAVSFLSLSVSGSSCDVRSTEGVRIGHMPASVMPATGQGEFIVHCSDGLYKVQIYDEGSQQRSPEVHKVWITDGYDPEWQQGTFAAVAIPVDQPGSDLRDPSIKSDELVCVDQDTIHFASMIRGQGVRNVPRQVKIGGTPSRILYSQHLERLIILSHEVVIVRPKRDTASRTVPGIRAFQPVITFLDADRDRMPDIKEEPLDADDAVDLDYDSTFHRHMEKQFEGKRIQLDYRPGERFLGIAEWFPKAEDTSRHMLIINTRQRAAANKGPGGRILIYTIHHQNGTFRLALKKEVSHGAPIHCVLPHVGTNMVFYSSGDVGRDASYVHGFVLVEEAGRLSFKLLKKFAIHSPARHMTFEGNVMYLSMMDGSVTSLELVGEELHSRFSDEVARLGVHHLRVPEYSLTLATDAGQSVTGLWTPTYQRIDNAMPTIFEAANLPHTITRLQRLEPPVWFQDNQSINLPLTFLGSSSAGSFMQIMILKPHQWPLLIFLDSFAQYSSLTAPFSSTTKRPTPSLTTFSAYAATDEAEAERAKSGTPPIHRHVNGDLLVRLIERGGAEQLEQWLNHSVRKNDPFANKNSAQGASGAAMGSRGHAWATGQVIHDIDNDSEDIDDADPNEDEYDNDDEDLEINEEQEDDEDGDDDDEEEEMDISDPEAAASSSSSSQAREERWKVFTALALQTLELDVDKDIRNQILIAAGPEEARRKRELVNRVMRWVSDILRPWL